MEGIQRKEGREALRVLEIIGIIIMALAFRRSMELDQLIGDEGYGIGVWGG
jgi:hypothetical protein